MRAPTLTLAGGSSKPAHAGHSGNAAVVKATVKVDEPSTLTITALGDASKELTLLRGSEAGSTVKSSSSTTFVYRAKSAGAIPLTLRVPYRSLKPGHSYEFVVVASVGAKKTRLVIHFRL